MSKQLRILILEVIWIAILGVFIYLIFNLNIDLNIFQILKVDTVSKEIGMIDDLNKSIDTSVQSYKNKISELEVAKSNFDKEKQKYTAISQDTLDLIQEAYTDEKYTIEYIWVKLGNYAKRSNLSIVIVEPEGNKVSEPQKEPESEVEENSDTSKALNEEAPSPQNAPEESTNTSMGFSSNSEELTIEVVGSYLDVADFVFNVENDETLHFKLDNIKMEYEGDNNIITSFVVKQMAIRK